MKSMNKTEESVSPEHITWGFERPTVCAILGLAFLIGVPGNLIVIWSICRNLKQKSSTVLLILNLAISDILVLATLPVWIYSFANQWVFGIPFCKILVYLIYCSMYSSVFFVTALSVERYLAVFHPFSMRIWKRNSFALKFILLIWVAAFLFGIPILPVQETEELGDALQCTCRNYASGTQAAGLLMLETLAGFVIPFCVICTCYACIGRRIRQMTYTAKRRSETLITSVVIAFAVCWMPHHVFNLLSVASVMLETSDPEMAATLDDITHMGVFISGALAFISSFINPLLYAFAARKFRNHVRLDKCAKLFELLSHSTREDSVSVRESSHMKETNEVFALSDR
ncbi:leukotriene B4 receptor 1-like [Lissotriton helveticus]